MHFNAIFIEFKRSFTNSNKNKLWHESEDTNKQSLFPKFKWIPIVRFQVMHNYVCVIAHIDYCVE